jgi:hypothetical protein
VQQLHLDQEAHLFRLAVLLDQLVDCIAVLHPADDATVVGQRQHRVTYDLQAAVVRQIVIVQARVDQTKQLHDAFVLAEVLVSLQQELVAVAIRAQHRHAAGTLLGGDDRDVVCEALNADVSTGGLVGTGHCEAEVRRVGQRWRNVVQLQLLQVDDLYFDALEQLLVSLPGLVQVSGAH